MSDNFLDTVEGHAGKPASSYDLGLSDVCCGAS